MFLLLWHSTLLVAADVNAVEAITLDEFKVRPIPAFAEKLEGQDLVDYLNIVQPFFEAGLSTLTEDEKKALIMDEQFLEKHNMAVASKERDFNNITIPESFDARVRWSACTSIKTIRDQSACGSCWAVSAASAMSDRLCIHSKEKIKLIVSDTDILTCCYYCGYGCSGGRKADAWNFAIFTGVCTGGAYGEKGRVCKPYPFHPCGYHKGQPYYGRCPKSGFSTPECLKVCQPGYLKAYDSDRIHAKNVYYIAQSVKAIQEEIMTNGPVLASFVVYADFFNYKGGVYVHTAGKKLGGHAVKIIGWGVEQNTPYWLVANSWSTDWGEHGLFRIARGKDECDIESSVVAGMMKV